MKLGQFSSQNEKMVSIARVFSSLVVIVIFLGCFAGTCEGGDNNIALFFFKGPGYKNVFRKMTEMAVGKCVRLDDELMMTEAMRVNGGCFLIFQGPSCEARRVSLRRFDQVNIKDKKLVPMSIKRESCTQAKPKDDDFATLYLYADTEFKKEIAAKRHLEMEVCTPLAEWREPIKGVQAVRGCFIIYEAYDCTGNQLTVRKYGKLELKKSGFRPESVQKIKCDY